MFKIGETYKNGYGDDIRIIANEPDLEQSLIGIMYYQPIGDDPPDKPELMQYYNNGQYDYSEKTKMDLIESHDSFLGEEFKKG